MSEPPWLYVQRDTVANLLGLPKRPWEVGGWLLGYWTARDSQIFVTHATPPTRGTPFHVRVSGRGHRKRFDEVYATTKGHVTFLGDWHTHPNGPTIPSRKDRAAMRQLAVERTYGTPRPLLAIVELATWPWQSTPGSIAFYVGGGGEPQALEPTVVDELPEEARDVPVWPWPSAGRGKRRRCLRDPSATE